MSFSTPTLYDEMPYERLAFPETFPRWLALLHRLYTGSKASFTETPDILEIGCGMGLNSCAMAAALPQGRVTGVDLSSTHIAEATKTKEHLKLNNVQFVQADILTHDLPTARFDFVIAHGIFSWVPQHVQESILAKSAACLRPNGLLLLSYNTLPGWAMRGLIRRMMTNATEGIQSLAERVSKARELLHITASMLGDHNRLSAPLRFEVERALQSPSSYTAHEYLAPHNDAFYFGQVIEMCANHNFSYSGDARPWGAWQYAIDPSRQQALRSLNINWMAREELADLLMNRSFRRSIFRKLNPNESTENSEPIVERPIALNTLRDLYFRLVTNVSFASDPIPSSGLSPNNGLVPTAITSISGKQRHLLSREEQLLVHELAKSTHTAISFNQLLNSLNGAVREDLAMEILERLFVEQYLDLYEHAHDFRWDPRAPLRITTLARYQSRQGLPITDNWLRPLPFSPQERSLLATLDGTRSIDELVTLTGTLPPQVQPQTSTDPFANQIPPSLASLIQRLEGFGLLERNTDG